MFKLVIILICFFVIGCSAICSRKIVYMPTNGQTANNWEYVADNKPIRLDISHLRIVGTISIEDRDSIINEVGKIKGMCPQILEIEAYGDDLYTAAIRVIAVEKYTVYLVRDKNGDLKISHVIIRDD